MREYGQIQCAFWNHSDIQALSVAAKLLAVYQLSGPHSNGIGCYRLPDGYISSDLGMVSETVTQTLSELLKVGFSKRCETTNFILIPAFLRWNKIANPNVAKSRSEEVRAVPLKFMFYSELVDCLSEYGNHWPNGFINGLSNHFEKVYLTEPNPTQPNPTLKECPGRGSVLSLGNTPKGTPPSDGQTESAVNGEKVQA